MPGTADEPRQIDRAAIAATASRCSAIPRAPAPREPAAARTPTPTATGNTTAQLGFAGSDARQVPWWAAQPRRYCQTATGSETATIASAHNSERVT
jgi:hypothetical protein